MEKVSFALKCLRCKALTILRDLDDFHCIRTGHLGFALMDVWICAKLAGADNEIMPSLPSSQEEAATNF
jgi:hypothetical protein